MSSIKFGSFVILKKKEEKSLFGDFFNVMSWFGESTEEEIQNAEHKKIDNIIVSFNYSDRAYDLKEYKLLPLDGSKEKYIKFSINNKFNNNILPLYIEIFNGDSKTTLFHDNNYKIKTESMFITNKNYNIENHETSKYNCAYIDLYKKDVLTISKIKNSNRCLFAYDETVLDEEFVLSILHKFLL